MKVLSEPIIFEKRFIRRENVVITGVAGRDFHKFNSCFRGNENYNVIAFLASQVPDIEGSRCP